MDLRDQTIPLLLLRNTSTAEMERNEVPYTQYLTLPQFHAAEKGDFVNSGLASLGCCSKEAFRSSRRVSGSRALLEFQYIALKRTQYHIDFSQNNGQRKMGLQHGT